MRTQKWRVQLSEQERQPLRDMLSKGTHQSRVHNRARVLLLSDAAKRDKEIAATLGVTAQTVANIRRRYAEGGLERALYDLPHRRRPAKLDSHQETYLVALACSAPPEGRRVWTMRLLADRLVQLGVVDGISHVTVYRLLKKRTEALAAPAVVHSDVGRGVRRSDGGDFRPV